MNPWTERGTRVNALLLVAGVALVASVTILVFSRMMSRRVERVVMDDFAGEGAVTARSAARRVGALFHGIGSELEGLRALSEVRDAGPGASSEAMKSTFRGMERYLSCLRRIDRRGDLRVGYHGTDCAPIEDASNESDRSWFRAAAAESGEADGPMVSEIFRNDAGERRVRVTLPIWREDGGGGRVFDGVITCVVRVDRVYGLMVEPFRELDPWKRLALFDDQGAIVALPGHAALEGRNPVRERDACTECHAFSAPLFDMVSRGSGWGTVEDPRFGPVVAICAPVELAGRNWVVGLYADRESLMRGAHEIARYSIFLAIGAILFVVAGALVVLLLLDARRVARRQRVVIERERTLFRRARESEARYRRLFEGVDNGVYLCSPEGRFLEVNGAMARMLGYDSPDSLLAAGPEARLYAHPGDGDRHRADMAAGRDIHNRESRLLRRDGAAIVCLETAIARHDEEGRVVEEMGVLVDITRRKRGELQVRERNNELRALHEVSKEIGRSLSIDEVLECSLEKILSATAFEAGSVHLFDEETETLIVRASAGTSPESLADPPAIRMSDEGLVGTIVHDREPVFLDSPAREPGAAVGVKSAYSAYAGIPLVFGNHLLGLLQIASSRPLERGEFHVEFLEGIAELISVAIRNAFLFEQIRRANEELNRVSAMKSQFVSLVSHELRTPMTAIRGSLDIIHSGAAGPVPEKHRLFISMARRNILRLSDMINNILDLSRIESGRIDYEFEAVDLREPLDQVLMTLAGPADEKKIALESRIPVDLPAVRGDAAKVEQILTNLIANAIKCTPNGGRIVVSAGMATREELDRLPEPPEGRAFCRVSVVDSGPGVPADRLEAVFDEFRQLEAQKGKRGSGLGLAICRSFVDGHGGAIWADRKEGKGGIFHFLLPVAVSGDAPVDPSEPPPEGA